MKGFFLTFEGVDRSGKSTQAVRLAEALAGRGLAVTHTREPGGTPLGERLRELLLDRTGGEMSWTVELFLLAADRARHVEEVVRPALEAGRIVICERFIDSSLAYQGYGLGGDLEAIRAVNAIAAGGLKPDFTVLLDLDPQSRRSAEREDDRIEARQADFHRRVRQGYLELWRQEADRILRLPGDGSVDAIHRRVLEETLRRLPAAALQEGRTGRRRRE